MGRFLVEHGFAIFFLLAAIPWIYEGGLFGVIVAGTVAVAGYEYVRRVNSKD